MFPSISSKNLQKNTTTIGFYNVENLFDTLNNAKTADDDFTSDGKKKWNYKRYKNKVKKIGSVISQLGKNHSKRLPALVGLVEVENAKVVSDLVNSFYLKQHHYGVVHHDSPDERGIDVALIYDKIVFEYLDSKAYPVFLKKENGERDFTRDILKVTGNLHGELVHVLVNHWSSRRAGTKETEPKRIIAAKTVKTIISDIKKKENDPKIIIMGDFNDDPTNKSVKDFLVGDDFFNPMEKLLNPEKTGSLTYNGKWNLFDQIIFSNNFLVKESGKLHFKSAAIFNKDWLKINRGKLKGSPYRTYISKWYQSGFSDHFPVYALLKKDA